MKRKVVILAEKKLGPFTSKMASGVIRFAPESICAVIDSSRAGKTVQEVLGFGGDIPIVATLEESLRLNPDTLLIGISPPGGNFPPEWSPHIIKALQNKLNVVNGLHEFISNVAEFKLLASKYGSKIIDLRKYEGPEIIARGKAKTFTSKHILTVGTHGSTGKMTTSIYVTKALQKLGKSADWFATGQIGIFLKGNGIPLDTIKGDFITGAVEYALSKTDGNFEYVVVEGQGSLLHLGYSPVSLGLMHGSLPDAMILCHRLDVGTNDYGVDIDDLSRAIEIHESMLAFVKPSKVVAISINTSGLPEEKALQILEETRSKYGLAVSDTARFGAEEIAGAIIDHFNNR